MVAQSIASRPRRPHQSEPDDVVLARALHFAEWVKRNTVLVVSVAAVLVVLVGGFVWYRMDQSRRMEEAAIAFLPVEQAVMSGEEATSVMELQSFIQRHGDTPYGDEARVLLAQVHLRGGRSAEAIETAQPVAARLGTSPVGAQAALLVGAAQEAAGQTDAAIESYLSVGREAELRFRRSEGLEGAALLMESSGDLARAADTYRELIELNENEAVESVYQMRLAEIEARMGAE